MLSDRNMENVDQIVDISRNRTPAHFQNISHDTGRDAIAIDQSG